MEFEKKSLDFETSNHILQHYKNCENETEIADIYNESDYVCRFLVNFFYIVYDYSDEELDITTIAMVKYLEKRILSSIYGISYCVETNTDENMFSGSYLCFYRSSIEYLRKSKYFFNNIESAINLYHAITNFDEIMKKYNRYSSEDDMCDYYIYNYLTERKHWWWEIPSIKM